MVRERGESLAPSRLRVRERQRKERDKLPEKLSRPAAKRRGMVSGAAHEKAVPARNGTRGIGPYPLKISMFSFLQRLFRAAQVRPS